MDGARVAVRLVDGKVDYVLARGGRDQEEVAALTRKLITAAA